MALADTFTRRNRIYGIGTTVTAFLMAYRREDKAWYKAGRPSAGNGALMRIAPVVLPHLRSMSWRLWQDVVVATVLTHRDEAAVAADVGFIGLLAECLARGVDGRDGTAPDIPARWWTETFLKYGRTVETGVVYERGGRGAPFRGSLCSWVEREVFSAIAAGTGVLEAAEGWCSGAYLLETVPCVLHILACHGNDPEEAIVRAVNDTWDNDTVAALVGAAVGAAHGLGALPGLWRAGLLGRTREADDGRVQELADKAVGDVCRTAEALNSVPVERYEALIFDLDGTLWDAAAGFVGRLESRACRTRAGGAGYGGRRPLGVRPPLRPFA